MNLGRKRTKHIDKEKKKFIYLTPCCLQSPPPLPAATTTPTLWGQGMWLFRLRWLEMSGQKAASIHHFPWSLALVFRKPTFSISESRRRSLMHREQEWGHPEILWKNLGSWHRSSKNLYCLYPKLPDEPGVYPPSSQAGEPLAQLALSLSWTLDVQRDWCGFDRTLQEVK